MIVRQLKAEKFDYFQNQLIKRAQQNPLEASFNVTVKVDRKEYVLRIQPENKHRVVALQALEVDRDEECGHLHMLITDNKILEEFYYGNINPNEKCFKRQSEFATFVKIVSDNEEKLIAYLGGEEKHLFSQLMNAQSEILDTEARERFIEGWKLGARFMLDTFITPRYSPINGVCEE